tara:strand:- start:15340 stop:15459 length:120 start_codon:yes stop_codon:yes gene_type:complete
MALLLPLVALFSGPWSPEDAGQLSLATHGLLIGGGSYGP